MREDREERERMGRFNRGGKRVLQFYSRRKERFGKRGGSTGQLIGSRLVGSGSGLGLGNG